MSQTLDARGLSCPQPVLLALEKIKSMGSGSLEILVDTEASKENVSRAVSGKGWNVDGITEVEGEFHLAISKG